MQPTTSNYRAVRSPNESQGVVFYIQVHVWETKNNPQLPLNSRPHHSSLSKATDSLLQIQFKMSPNLNFKDICDCFFWTLKPCYLAFFKICNFEMRTNHLRNGNCFPLNFKYGKIIHWINNFLISTFWGNQVQLCLLILALLNRLCNLLIYHLSFAFHECPPTPTSKRQDAVLSLPSKNC